MASPLKVNKLNETACSIQVNFAKNKICEILKDFEDENITDAEITSKILIFICQNEMAEMKKLVRSFQVGRLKMSILHHAVRNLRSNLCEFLIDNIKIG